MHLHFSWNFQWDMFTLTIYFIVLNVYIEFVLIYRPHPVYIKFLRSSISWGHIQSPWLGDKVDSGIGLPTVNVLESTPEWT